MNAVKMKVAKINTPEYVSNDILQEDFMKTFRAFGRIQMVLGSCRVHARNRFVTSPTVYQKIYTAICILIMTSLYFVIIKTYLSRFAEYTNIYYLSISATGVDMVAYICNMIHVRFFNNNANPDFYIKLQSIDRLMKIDQINILNKILYKINLSTIVILLLIFTMLCLSSFIRSGVSFICFASFLYNKLTFILELGFCSNLVLYFYMRIRFVNSIIKKHLNHPHKTNLLPKIYNLPYKKLLMHLVAESHDFSSSDTDIYLKEIFEGFSKFQEIYRFQVCIFCVKLVLLSLLTFEFTLFAAQRNLIKLTEILFLVIYAAMDFLTALFLSLRCEVFFRQVKETKRLCIAIMMRYQEGPLREKARKMWKMIEESPPSFSVYDMWCMDASIFVKMLSLITSLVVTLLQFAFL